MSTWRAGALVLAFLTLPLAACTGSDAAADDPQPGATAPRDVLLIWDPTSSKSSDQATVEATLAAVEEAVLDRLEQGGSLHLFTVDEAALHQVPRELRVERLDDERKHGGTERFRKRIRAELTQRVEDLPASWQQAHRVTAGGGVQPLASCLLSSLDRAARLIGGPPAERRYELILVSDLQEACRDWGGERGINLELGAEQLAVFAGLDWTTDLHRVERVTIFLLPPARGLERGQEQRALQQAWRKHFAAAGVPAEAIVFR